MEAVEPEPKKRKAVEQDKKAEEENEEEDDEQIEPERDQFGNAFFQLSPKRRCTIKTFNNVKMVDIREFYEKDGQMMPGKKGISLNLDQFELLKELVTSGSVDQAIKDLS